MKWRGGRRSSNVDDRRHRSGSGGGGLSMGTAVFLFRMLGPLLRTKFGWAIIALGVVAYFAGFNPLSMVDVGVPATKVVDEKKDDENAAFMSTVLANIEDVWNKQLRGYKDPVMVLYRGAVRSGCGFASAQVGPFYCPADQKVYLDLGFFEELANNHNAPGDFAQAYVLAHEVGHHIQNLLGTLAKVQKAKQQWGGKSKEANALQVRVELQADCYAGAWAHHAHKQFGIIEEGDVEEALQAASAIGDDTLQRKATGHVRPDAFTHGSSADRVKWFRIGLRTGDLRECNTFK